MTRDERIRTLGSLGERLVIKFFDMKGCAVDQSPDPYDSEKDMTVDGLTVEVKTLLPINIYKAFCLPVKQSRKCENVDRLIFVKIPDNPGDPIDLYESIRDEDTGRRYDFRDYFNNEHCQFYRLTFLEKLGTINDPEGSNAIWNLSPSTYKGKLSAA